MSSVSRSSVAQVECIENRRLFSGVEVSSLFGNVLTVSGDDGVNDQITVSLSPDGSKVNVTINGVDQTPTPTDDLRTVRVSAGSGDDTITVLEGAGTGGKFKMLTLLEGGDGNDKITGGSGADVIRGGAGNDTIDAGDGFNIVGGGDGNDHITGGPGHDVVLAGAGDDIVDTLGGNDAVYGAGGKDNLKTGDGDDFVYAGSNDDTVDAGQGDNWIEGNDGNDTLKAGEGDDTILGGAGADTIDAGAGDNDVQDDPQQFDFWSWIDGLIHRFVNKSGN